MNRQDKVLIAVLFGTPCLLFVAGLFVVSQFATQSRQRGRTPASKQASARYAVVRLASM